MRWYPDGMLNVCHNALDRHVAAGRGESTALVYDSAVLGIQERFSYARAAGRGRDASPGSCGPRGSEWATGC